MQVQLRIVNKLLYVSSNSSSSARPFTAVETCPCLRPSCRCRMIDISANRQINNCTAVYRGTSCHLAAKNRIARSRDAGPQSSGNKHFLSRVGTVTRYWFGIYVRLSVRLSVALWLNCSTYRQTLASGMAIILGFFHILGFSNLTGITKFRQ